MLGTISVAGFGNVFYGREENFPFPQAGKICSPEKPHSIFLIHSIQ
jgi:hypothetical protein